MAAHACLKNEFTEDEKYHNLTSLLELFSFLEAAASQISRFRIGHKKMFHIAYSTAYKSIIRLNSV